MSKITIDIDNVKPFINDNDINEIQDVISKLHSQLEKGEGLGNNFLGWLHIPSTISNELINKINNIAAYVRNNADVFISVGIGGSYLGAKAATEFVNHSFANKLTDDSRKWPEIYFAGQNISSDYLSDLTDIIQDKRVCINVISKSGTTLEPAITFRILKKLIENKYGKKEAKNRIIITTDKKKGALKRLADEEGYTTFEIPDDVGGRFSVLTPVGLIPIAVSGVNINDLINGAKLYEDITANPSLESNHAYLYAAVRNILYQKGKTIELLSSFHPSLHYLAEWWKQLAGESEGKNQAGIFPASVDFTTDLHSMGQWIQDGSRVIFETFMTIEKSNKEMTIPYFEEDGDELNYIAGKSLDYVNDKAYKGTAIAHKDGKVPNMTIILKDRSSNTLGQIFYFFEKAIAISGYMQNVNPFDQPGVEFYKKNMFDLLGKGKC